MFGKIFSLFLSGLQISLKNIYFSLFILILGNKNLREMNLKYEKYLQHKRKQEVYSIKTSSSEKSFSLENDPGLK